MLAESSAAPVRCLTLDRNECTNKIIDMTTVRSHYKPDEIVLLLDDVTERYKLDKMKLELINLLGGALQKPLVDVQSIMTRLIDKQAFDQPRRARLKRIHGNIDRLLKLIDQLLNLERLGVGMLVGEKEPCQLLDIVSDAFSSTKDYAEQQRMRLIWDGGACDGIVFGDAQRLTQVLINLITNAIKYSPADTAISVAVSSVATELEIRISDEGRGVPEEMRDAIFEPFVQTQTSDGRRGAGTGLGLSICRQIVEGHGGRIGVDGKPEGGSVFWIRLPAHGYSQQSHRDGSRANADGDSAH